MSRRATRLRSSRFLLILVVAIALVGSACGSDDDGATGDITSEGHGEGEIDGHSLAVGENTPTDPQGRFYLHQGDEGPDVETLQARLIELGAPLDGADGVYGDQTLHAVLAFQRSEGLTADGVVGTDTWATLDTPVGEPDWTLPDLPDEYATDVPETAGESGPPTTDEPAATGDGSNVGSHAAPDRDPASGSGGWARAVVTLSSETATFYDEEGSIVLQAPISSGKDGLTPVGTFHVQSKSERAFAGGDSGVYMDWMTRFNGGIGFHSIPKRSDGSDIETPLGQRAVSHGCIRMADENAELVFSNLPIGAPVEVHP